MARGRPRKIDPQQALDTAMKVFWEKGYDGTSMNDLVAATGMAKPGLYAAFGDKENLYTKALSHYFNDLGSPLMNDLCTSTDPLKAVLLRFFNKITEATMGREYPSGCFVVNSIVECCARPPALEALGRSFDEQRRTVFHKRFQAALENGELPPEADATALADFYSAQVLALAVMGRAGTDRDTINRFITVVMSVLPDGNED